MAGPANDPPDAKMLELVSSEKTKLELTCESSSFSNDDESKSNGPLTTALSREENCAHTSRESVLRRLSEALMRHSLAEIDLSQRGLQSSDARLVKMALSQNSNLTVLKLGYNNLGDHGVTTLASGIALHNSLGLLDLGFNNFGDEGAKALADAMHQAFQSVSVEHVHTLYLAGNLIGEDGAVAIADFIRKGSHIRKLYMTGNRIGANGVRAITEAILEDETRRTGDACTSNGVTATDPSEDTNHKPTKSKLKQHFEGMQELFLGGTGIGTSGCQAVARLLERSSSLKVISLPNCEIGDDEMGILSNSLRANKSRLPIESIQLSFNRITHRGLEALSNALWGSTTLKELKLDNNMIGDRGAHQLAAIFPALKSLVTLDVGFNGIKTAGLNVLMKAVVDTDQIESLSLSGNDIDDIPSAKAVAYTLAYNQTLKSIYLVHCSIRDEGKRHITAGAVSNAHTSLRSLTGFEVGPVVAKLGFPEALKHWNNEQVMNFIHLMYEKHDGKDEDSQSAAQRELDPLSFLPGAGEDTSSAARPKPLEAHLVVEIAKNTYASLIANGVDVFSRRRGVAEPSFGSPLASDTILIETGASALTINDSSDQKGTGDTHCTGLPVNQARSFVAPPEASVNAKKPEMPDPARKQRIVEWLCTNIEHLNELAQLPFSSRELWRLHQHYFTPVVNECGGAIMHSGSGAVSSVPEGMREYQGSAVTPSIESCIDASQVSDPAFQGSPMAPASLPLLKRKVSYRFLGDASMTSHQSRVEPKLDNLLQNGSIAKLIEDGHTGHSLPRKTKRARQNRTRISFVPRIKAKLDSYMDVCHEKALITMRQLYFVEQAILKGQVNGLEASAQPRIHLSGVLASEAEMIIVDMI